VLQGEKKKLNVSRVVKILGEVKQILDKRGVTFWLDSGTLLGAVRDGKIIDWDVDVDLGVFFTDIEKIVSGKNEFKKNKLEILVSRRYGSMFIHREGCGISFVLFRVRGGLAWALFPSQCSKTCELLAWFLSIFSFERYGAKSEYFKRKSGLFVNLLPSNLKRFIKNVTWFIMNKRSCVKLWVIPNHFFMQLSTIEFYGMKFNSPFKVKEYLRYRYGTNWKTPNRNWVWFRDDGAVKYLKRKC